MFHAVWESSPDSKELPISTSSPQYCTYSIDQINIGLSLQYVFSLASGIVDDAGNILRHNLIKNLLP